MFPELGSTYHRDIAFVRKKVTCLQSFYNYSYFFIFRLGAECELTMPSLGVLTNLCRNNIAVQAQVKALV